MQKIKKLIQKNFKLLVRSKFSASIIILGPILIMLLSGLAFSNTNTYQLNIGIFSEEYNELTESFLDKLEQQQFTILKTSSQEKCINQIKEGDSHICVVFPYDFSIESEKNDITFYVDFSKPNLVWATINQVSSVFSNRSTELSMDLTQSLLDYLESTRIELEGKDQTIDTLISDNNAITSELDIIKQKLNDMGISMDLNNFPTSQITTTNSEIYTLVESLKTDGLSKTSDITDLIDDIESEVNNLNISSSEKSTILDLIDDIELKITTLNTDLTTTYNSSSEKFTNLSSIIGNISQNLNTLKSNLDSASTSRSDIITKIDTLKQKLTTSTASLSTLQESINTINSNLQTLSTQDVSTIVNPTNLNIHAVSTDKTHLDYFFPTLLTLMIMFISILLASNLVVMEKTSTAHFRDIITPTKNAIFLFANYLTCTIITLIQIFLLLAIGLSIFNLSIGIFSLNFLNILAIAFLISTLFIFLGTFIGYVFKSRETALLGAISFSTIFFILSDIILPIESIPSKFAFLTNFNPFMVSNLALRKSIIFGKSILQTKGDILTITIMIILFIALSLLSFWHFHKKHFWHIHRKHVLKQKKK